MFENYPDSKTYLGEIRKKADGNLTKAQRTKRQFDTCIAILNTNTNIDELYLDQPLDNDPKYYVYAHLDTTRKIAIGKDGKTTFAATLGMEFFPFYIGKGCGDRAFDVNRNETHRKIRERMKTFGFEPKIQILENWFDRSRSTYFGK